MKKICLPVLLTAMASASPAIASSSQWFDTDGARVRLVTTGQPDSAGRIAGALEILLKPGWKTYWRDPGDAGVPPMIEISASTNVQSADLAFPAPQRHDEGDFSWAGYDYPVTLPVDFTIANADQPARIEADVFLGVCETICIPVKATLSLDPASDPDNADDSTTVAMARDALPHTDQPDFGVRVVGEPNAGAIVLEAVFPGDPASAELFIAGDQGYSFTTPVKTIAGGKTTFTAQTSQPEVPVTGPGLPYTLVTDAGAVSGFLPYF